MPKPKTKAAKARRLVERAEFGVDADRRDSDLAALWRVVQALAERRQAIPVPLTQALAKLRPRWTKEQATEIARWHPAAIQWADTADRNRNELDFGHGRPNQG